METFLQLVGHVRHIAQTHTSGVQRRRERDEQEEAHNHFKLLLVLAGTCTRATACDDAEEREEAQRDKHNRESVEGKPRKRVTERQSFVVAMACPCPSRHTLTTAM